MRLMSEPISGPQSPLPGDGRGPIDTRLCRMCILAAIIIAFGDKALMFI
jgi:hypothetical protein